MALCRLQMWPLVPSFWDIFPPQFQKTLTTKAPQYNGSIDSSDHWYWKSGNLVLAQFDIKVSIF